MAQLKHLLTTHFGLNALGLPSTFEVQGVLQMFHEFPIPMSSMDAFLMKKDFFSLEDITKTWHKALEGPLKALQWSVLLCSAKYAPLDLGLQLIQ